MNTNLGIVDDDDLLKKGMDLNFEIDDMVNWRKRVCGRSFFLVGWGEEGEECDVFIGVEIAL